MRNWLPLLLSALGAMILATDAHAISFEPFGPSLEGGSLHGQSLQIGAGGRVFELDAFVSIEGLDLNGAGAGGAARLSTESLPPGLDLALSISLSPDATDLTLRYVLGNRSGADLLGVTFLSFLDAEIDEPLNTFFNEYATVVGAPASGQGFEIDEPGFAFGDIYDNLVQGVLDGTNAVPFGSPDDVSMALSFRVAALGAGQELSVDILLSEDGDALGPLLLIQQDTDARSTTSISYSGAAVLRGGQAPIPEPGAALLFGIGSLVLMGFRDHR